MGLVEAEGIPILTPYRTSDGKVALIKWDVKVKGEKETPTPVLQLFYFYFSVLLRAELEPHFQDSCSNPILVHHIVTK